MRQVLCAVLVIVFRGELCFLVCFFCFNCFEFVNSCLIETEIES